MNKMRILVFNWQDIKNPFGGGAEVHFHEIFKRIASKGHDVTLVSSGFDGGSDEEIIDGIKVIRRGSRSLYNFYVLPAYRKLIKTNSYDIIIDDINKIPFYTPLFVKKPLLAISHHFFGKSIFRETGIISGLYVYLSEKLVDFIYKKTHFAVVSQSTHNEFLERGFDKKNFSIVENAIAHEDFPMKIGIKNTDFTVTYFGRLKKYKSVDHLFYAFADFNKSNPGSKLWIIGKGDYQPYLEELSRKLNISGSTVFHGYVSDDKKKELLSLSHVVVNTSMKEGWGITNIEANACGTPVLSANVPGLRDSVKSGESGLLYEYGNIKEMTTKLEELYLDNELYNKLSNGSIEWAKQFSWDKSSQKMIEVMEMVLNKS